MHEQKACTHRNNSINCGASSPPVPTRSVTAGRGRFMFNAARGLTRCWLDVYEPPRKRPRRPHDMEKSGTQFRFRFRKRANIYAHCPAAPYHRFTFKVALVRIDIQ
ncbi:hypothetical protein EVAR_77263_1 [Eumeta japonica]|uniref:Uncharacterized protein n=1 Tax=Eumeta variegata TaxID=151549 RepID=A0A4C1ULP8_EUMVA|nr:hypothetical protein EVAR_77263_1 [Eumeta japonica]